MEKLQELIRVLSDDRVKASAETAKATGTCKICGKCARLFNSPRAELEYSISAICETCQNYYLPSTDHCIKTIKSIDP